MLAAIAAATIGIVVGITGLPARSASRLPTLTALASE
jgi:hypothetical protein